MKLYLVMERMDDHWKMEIISIGEEDETYLGLPNNDKSAFPKDRSYD